MKHMSENYKGIIFVVLLMIFLISISNKVLAAPGSTKETAETVSIGKSIEESFAEASADQIHYYRVDIPENVGNQYIAISMSNYANKGLYFEIRNALDEKIYKGGNVNNNKSTILRFRIKNTVTTSNTVVLIPGESYYIRIESNKHTVGNYNMSITATPDDNWGTFENSPRCIPGQKVTGVIEYADDIDCFGFVLPNDKQKYTFYISADNRLDALLADANGIKIADTGIDNINVNNKLSVYGLGQTVYIRVNRGYVTQTANYSIELKAEKETVSVLNLSSYKKGSKKITGKTIGGAKIVVKIGKKKYSTKSDKTGKFTVKLKKKLKSKNKIKVTVSKKNYLTKSKTFKVR